MYIYIYIVIYIIYLSPIVFLPRASLPFASFPATPLCPLTLNILGEMVPIYSAVKKS